MVVRRLKCPICNNYRQFCRSIFPRRNETVISAPDIRLNAMNKGIIAANSLSLGASKTFVVGYFSLLVGYVIK